MDNNIQVVTVYVDGTVCIYGAAPKGNWPRKFIRAMKFSTYGKALQFAIEFEEEQKRKFGEG